MAIGGKNNQKVEAVRSSMLPHFGSRRLTKVQKWDAEQISLITFAKWLFLDSYPTMNNLMTELEVSGIVLLVFEMYKRKCACDGAFCT